jgi:hypothetical protein
MWFFLVITVGEANTLHLLNKMSQFNSSTTQDIIPPVRVLREKLEVAVEIRKLNESTLPASVKQLLIDSLINEYIAVAPKPQSYDERWVDVAQKAQELGFEITRSNRSLLDRYVSKYSDRRLTRRSEERVSRGTTVLIWVYLDTKKLEETIRDFFTL